MEKDESIYWMALAHAERVWARRKNEIVVACFRRNETLLDFYGASEREWRDVYRLDLTADEVSALNESKARLANYSFLAEDLLEQGYDLIPITSPEYPRTLKEHLKYGSPVLLYVKGNRSLLSRECVAIVGSRKAGDISLTFTDNVAAKVVRRGSVVVSGYARGVDQQAFLSAVKHGGSSIIVLPQGIMTFSSAFRSLHKQIVSGNLLVMSYFPPRAPWSVGLAMARNAVVYAMAETIYVAESGFEGGTYEGAKSGLRAGRRIYVRWPEDSEHNANRSLVEAGAVPVDLCGNEIEGPESEFDVISREIRVWLSRGEMSAKELSKAILSSDDRAAQSKVRRILESMDDVVKVRTRSPITYTLKGVQRTLL